MTIKMELQFKTLTLEDLLEGKANVFAWVHMSGIMQLVSKETSMNESNTPATLSMDVHRLNRFQLEFQALTTAMTMLVSLQHVLASKKKDITLVHKIAEEVFLSTADVQEDLEQIIEKISMILDEEDKKEIVRMLTQCASPMDAEHKLM